MSRSRPRMETNYVDDNVFLRIYEVGDEEPRAQIKMALPTWVLLSQRIAEDAKHRYRKRMKRKLDREEPIVNFEELREALL